MYIPTSKFLKYLFCLMCVYVGLLCMCVCLSAYNSTYRIRKIQQMIVTLQMYVSFVVFCFKYLILKKNYKND